MTIIQKLTTMYPIYKCPREKAKWPCRGARCDDGCKRKALYE